MNFRLVKFIGTKTRVFICPFIANIYKKKTAKVYGVKEKWWTRASVRKVSEREKERKKKSESKRNESKREILRKKKSKQKII